MGDFKEILLKWFSKFFKEFNFDKIELNFVYFLEIFKIKFNV